MLKTGGVIVFPTETSYGIGCDATNAKAVRKVFAIKGRPDGKGTPLIVDSIKMAEEWGEFSPTAKKITKTYWPGALTIVVPVRRGAPKGARKLVSNILQDGSVALRVSANPTARALARGLGRPIVATSANRSGEPPCYSIRAFLRYVGAGFPHPCLDAILDVGALPRRKPTTLIKIVGDKIEVLRQGKIKL